LLLDRQISFEFSLVSGRCRFDRSAGTKIMSSGIRFFCYTVGKKQTASVNEEGRGVTVRQYRQAPNLRLIHKLREGNTRGRHGSFVRHDLAARHALTRRYSEITQSLIASSILRRCPGEKFFIIPTTYLAPCAKSGGLHAARRHR